MSTEEYMDNNFTPERSSVPSLTERSIHDLIQWLQEKGVAIDKPGLVAMLKEEERLSNRSMEFSGETGQKKIYYSRGKSEIGAYLHVWSFVV